MSRPNPPRLPVRWRLTLLYSLMFVVCGAGLLAVTYDLFANFAYSPPKPGLGPGGAAISPTSVQVATAMSVQRSIGLHRLQLYSVIALAVMAIVSVVLGWVVAGRALAPLRAITSKTDQISDSNLHERLAMLGPRDELRDLADTIDRLLERLDAAFEAQRRFVANASHELRTPLAVMRTTLDVAIAKPGDVPPQTRELDAELRVDLGHADQLLESFLMLARAEHGELGRTEAVALEPLITSVLCDQAAAAARKHLDVETRLATVAVAGSATLLARMIANVIENAVRHTEPHGSITVTVSGHSADRARITVENSGPALDQRAVAQLAQPFKRLGRDRTGSSDGHGLGLSIVTAVAAAHGGAVDLHARPEGGLRVEITLPAVVAPLAEAAG